jgi:hypothetical protein
MICLRRPGWSACSHEGRAVNDDRSVARENVRVLRSRLEAGADANTRAIMLKLLIEEENKLGFNREQLDRLDRHISLLIEDMRIEGNLNG